MPPSRFRPSQPWNVVLWIVVAVSGGSALTYIVAFGVRSYLHSSTADVQNASESPPAAVLEPVVEAPESEPEPDQETVADLRRRTEVLLASAETLDRSSEAACLAGVEELAPQVARLQERAYGVPRELMLLTSAMNYTVLCAACEGSSARNCDRARNDLRDLDAQ